MYNVSWEAVVAGAELNLTSATTVPCQHGWEYDMEGYHVSLTVEQDWVDTGCQATPCHLSHETTAAGV